LKSDRANRRENDTGCHRTAPTTYTHNHRRWRGWRVARGAGQPKRRAGGGRDGAGRGWAGAGGAGAVRRREAERERRAKQPFGLPRYRTSPNRALPCGRDTDCRLRLREGFVGQKVFSCSGWDAVIRVYDEAVDVIETHEHKGDIKELS
jgi:hypothetical protein